MASKDAIFAVCRLKVGRLTRALLSTHYMVLSGNSTQSGLVGIEEENRFILIANLTGSGST